MTTNEKYCPFCQRFIAPERDEFGDLIKFDGGLIYCHDEVEHDPDYTFEDLQ